MATITANYDWPIPQSTDLVKDGATAIASLGNAIDTSLAAGKGEILVGTTNNTVDNLAVGSNGDALFADSSTTTGLRWQPAKAVNHVINGGQDFWQRGTSFALTNNVGIYTADRFMALQSGGTSGTTVSRQTTSDTTNLPDIEYCARVQRNSGSTHTGVIYYFSSLESAETRQLQGKTVVLSFWARKGANYSSATDRLEVNIRQGTGTNQNMLTGFTNETTVAGQLVTLTGTWQRFQVTGTVNATTTQLGLRFFFQGSGTAGAADYFEVTGIQLELGSIATTFQRAGGTLAGELAACQRYYQKSYQQSVLPAAVGSTSGLVGFNNTSTANSNAYGHVHLPVVMRISPTVTIYGYNGNATNISNKLNGTDQGANTGLALHIGESGFNVDNQSGGTVTTASGAVCHFVASAEL